MSNFAFLQAARAHVECWQLVASELRNEHLNHSLQR